MSIKNLLYGNYKNIAKYKSKYYIFKIRIIEQNIMIKDVLKIFIFSNLKYIFKTYFMILINQIKKDTKLDKNKILFKANKKKKPG